MSVEELKQLQSEIIRKNKKCNIIGLIVFLVLMTLTIVYFKIKNIPLEMLLATAPFALLIYLFFIMYIKSKVNGKDIDKFNKEYKNTFVLKSLNNIFEDIKYNPNNGFKEEYIEKIGMLDTGDSYSSNDYISGKYKNISFEQSDVHIMEKHEEKNEHEAFYILTPHFMEKLKEITKKLKCGVMFCFVDNKLHIAVDNYKDLFEYNVFNPINEKEIEESITKDIKLITNFVEELDLDNNLFKTN